MSQCWVPSCTSYLTKLHHRRLGMCQHTVLDDGLDNSQKGNSPVTRSVVCCLQDRYAVFYVDSMVNIVRYMYIKMLQKIWIFYQPSV